MASILYISDSDEFSDYGNEEVSGRGLKHMPVEEIEMPDDSREDQRPEDLEEQLAEAAREDAQLPVRSRCSYSLSAAASRREVVLLRQQLSKLHAERSAFEKENRQLQDQLSESQRISCQDTTYYEGQLSVAKKEVEMCRFWIIELQTENEELAEKNRQIAERLKMSESSGRMYMEQKKKTEKSLANIREYTRVLKEENEALEDELEELREKVEDSEKRLGEFQNLFQLTNQQLQELQENAFGDWKAQMDQSGSVPAKSCENDSRSSRKSATDGSCRLRSSSRSAGRTKRSSSDLWQHTILRWMNWCRFWLARTRSAPTWRRRIKS
ncbi:hypothetical protein L596_015901 [Steinernema carpocapsae]|uniref:Uncharacterized protein n=1 Tax=Steinernema carpocapsae TaxID=34508 RepID=A0A4U5NGH1_STECR|nr:hypothetical protein L596_015901 [Steinernema carpocapsae]